MHSYFSGVTSCISYFWMSSAASSSVAILCGWNINGVNDTHRTKTDIGNTITNIGNISVPCANRAALIVGSTFLINVKFDAMFSGCRLLETAPTPWFPSPIQILLRSWGELSASKRFVWRDGNIKLLDTQILQKWVLSAKVIDWHIDPKGLKER